LLNNLKNNIIFRLKRLCIPILVVGIALAGRWLLEPVLHNRLPYGFFLVGVVVTALLADFWEAIVALFLGFLAGSYFFTNPRWSFVVSDADAQLGAAVYFITGLAIVWLAKSKEAARLRALMIEFELRKQQELIAQEKSQRGQTRDIQEMLAEIVESAQDAIISITQEGRIVTWNAAAESLFEFTAKQAIGQRLTLIVPPERRTEMERILEKVKSGGRADPWQTVLRREDGSRVEVWATFSPVRDRTGKIVEAAIIARENRRREQQAT
jgi:PAS domain S-box-containing protein